ncbi:FHA domain-containing protein [Ruania halotolerans]|uniref:FHA domain-containing protein n=1 Tax=Ruania halotolerans TaxID=2897773 RepID=UPI001E5FA5E6|nr:FHA domain-containing protein [Ruania halotolerans]UFU04922.1 hypothetical protein LQF10_10560 [Ruania halotolerans]
MSFLNLNRAAEGYLNPPADRPRWPDTWTLRRTRGEALSRLLAAYSGWSRTVAGAVAVGVVIGAAYLVGMGLDGADAGWSSIVLAVAGALLGLGGLIACGYVLITGLTVVGAVRSWAGIRAQDGGPGVRTVLTPALVVRLALAVVGMAVGIWFVLGLLDVVDPVLDPHGGRFTLWAGAGTVVLAGVTALLGFALVLAAARRSPAGRRSGRSSTGAEGHDGVPMAGVGTAVGTGMETGAGAGPGAAAAPAPGVPPVPDAPAPWASGPGSAAPPQSGGYGQSPPVTHGYGAPGSPGSPEPQGYGPPGAHGGGQSAAVGMPGAAASGAPVDGHVLHEDRHSDHHVPGEGAWAPPPSSGSTQHPPGSPSRPGLDTPAGAPWEAPAVPAPPASDAAGAWSSGSDGVQEGVGVPPSGLEATAVRPGAQAQDSADDLDDTRLVAGDGTGVRVRFHMEDGRVMGSEGVSLLGRAPAAREGETVAALVTLSDSAVSKTHLALRIEGARAWVSDRASTNGTILVTSAGEERRLVPWEETPVAPGETLQVGASVLRVELDRSPGATTLSRDGE